MLTRELLVFFLLTLFLEKSLRLCMVLPVSCNKRKCKIFTFWSWLKKGDPFSPSMHEANHLKSITGHFILQSISKVSKRKKALKSSLICIKISESWHFLSRWKSGPSCYWVPSNRALFQAHFWAASSGSSYPLKWVKPLQFYLIASKVILELKSSLKT